MLPMSLLADLTTMHLLILGEFLSTDIDKIISDLGGGQDTIVTKAARKMLQSDQVITKWAPALLQMTLDEFLWKDSDSIQIIKLWEYLSTYCYLPRLSSYTVLEETVCQGVASDEYFGIASAYTNDRYVDLKWNQSIFSFNSTDLLVKPAVAKAQIEKEKAVPSQTGETSGNGTGCPGSAESTGQYPLSSGASGSGSANNEAGGSSTSSSHSNKHFFMSVDVDPVRVNKVVSTYVDEIIRHLMQVDGATVELKLDVDVIAPGGIPAATVRTVSENCKTLKITDFGFDD